MARAGSHWLLSSAGIFTAISVSLRGPVAGAARASRIAAPGPSAGSARQPSRARGVFILNGHRGANRTGSRDVTPEPDEIRMRDNSVGDVDGEIVGRIASASLRHKDKVPGSIVRGAGVCRGCKGDKTARGCSISEKLFHLFLQSCRHRPRREPEQSLRRRIPSRIPKARDRMLVQSCFKASSRRLQIGSRVICGCVTCTALVRSNFTTGQIGGIVPSLTGRNLTRIWRRRE